MASLTHVLCSLRALLPLTVRDEKVEKVSKAEFYDLMTNYAKVCALPVDDSTGERLASMAQSLD